MRFPNTFAGDSVPNARDANSGIRVGDAESPNLKGFVPSLFNALRVSTSVTKSTARQHFFHPLLNCPTDLTRLQLGVSVAREPATALPAECFAVALKFESGGVEGNAMTSLSRCVASCNARKREDKGALDSSSWISSSETAAVAIQGSRCRIRPALKPCPPQQEDCTMHRTDAGGLLS